MYVVTTLLDITSWCIKNMPGIVDKSVLDVANVLKMYWNALLFADVLMFATLIHLFDHLHDYKINLNLGLRTLTFYNNVDCCYTIYDTNKHSKINFKCMWN